MLKRSALTALTICLLAQPQAWAGGGQAHFDLAQMPGSYVARTSDVQVQVKIDHPEVIKQALDSDPPDSSPNDPTMDTDDGETLGPHTLEVDLITDCEHASDDKSCDAGIDTTVGVGNHLQFNVEKFVTRDKPKGQPASTSVSATNIGVKYNFLEKNGWAMAVYPAVELNDATDSDGHVLYIPLMISKQINNKTTAAATVQVGRSIEHPDVNSLNMSVAIGRAVSETSKLMAEVSSERSSSDKVTYMHVGYMKVIFAKPTSRYQMSVFSALARTVGRTPEGKPRYAIRMGLAVNLQPLTQN